MHYLFVSLLILLSFTGCEDKEQQAKHDAKVAQQARAELLAELEAQKQQEDTKFNKMGIHVDDSTITIDTNKTKTFFHDLGKRMDTRMKKMAEDIEKGMIEHKEAGIEINEQHIHIDLNTTRDLLLEWGKQIQVFVEEFDTMAETLEINSTNATNKGIECNR